MKRETGAPFRFLVCRQGMYKRHYDFWRFESMLGKERSNCSEVRADDGLQDWGDGYSLRFTKLPALVKKKGNSNDFYNKFAQAWLEFRSSGWFSGRYFLIMLDGKGNSQGQLQIVEISLPCSFTESCWGHPLFRHWNNFGTSHLPAENQSCRDTPRSHEEQGIIASWAQTAAQDTLSISPLAPTCFSTKEWVRWEDFRVTFIPMFARSVSHPLLGVKQTQKPWNWISCDMLGFWRFS